MYKEILYILIQRSYLYMANHRSIQILRASNVDGSIQNEKLLEGQPFYNEQKNYLTIGKNADSTVSDFPITVRELVGYVDDSTKITNTKTNEYSLKYSNTDNSLKITSPTGININSGNSDTSNITINRGNASKIVLGKSNIELDVNSLTVKPNTDNVATISTSATNGFILKDGVSQTNLATVEMGALKLNTLYDVATGEQQASLSSDGIEVKKKLKVDTDLEVINNLKVNNVLTPKYIGTTNSKLNFSFDGDALGKLRINTERISGKESIKEFVFFAGNETDKADITVKKVWTTDIDTNSAVVNKTLEVKQEAYLKQDLDVTGATLSRGDLLFKSNLAFRENESTNRIIIEKVTLGNIIYLDLKNIRNIQALGIIKTTSSADNAIDASRGTVKAQSFNAVSDRRLKENIVEYSPNKSILDLPIYSYNFISDEKKTKKIGCLAQDLKEICPEIVKEDDNGYLSIEENKIVYLLLDEVKKLKKRVDELEAR